MTYTETTQQASSLFIRKYPSIPFAVNNNGVLT